MDGGVNLAFIFWQGIHVCPGLLFQPESSLRPAGASGLDRMKRLGAGNYLLAMSGSVILWAAFISVLCGNLASQGVFTLKTLNGWVAFSVLFLSGSVYIFSAARLRDLDCPRWAVWVFAFPLLAVMGLPVLCLLSGQRWENRYGPPGPRSGPFKLAAAVVIFFLAITSSCAALSDYQEACREMPETLR